MQYVLFKTKQVQDRDGFSVKFQFFHELDKSGEWDQPSRRFVLGAGLKCFMVEGVRCPGYRFSLMVFSGSRAGVALRVDTAGVKVHMSLITALQNVLQCYMDNLV